MRDYQDVMASVLLNSLSVASPRIDPRLPRPAVNAPSFGTLFEKPLSQHRCKLLILRGGICRSEDSEYI
jgi:hypothetical protein